MDSNSNLNITINSKESLPSPKRQTLVTFNVNDKKQFSSKDSDYISSTKRLSNLRGSEKNTSPNNIFNSIEKEILSPANKRQTIYESQSNANLINMTNTSVGSGNNFVIKKGMGKEYAKSLNSTLHNIKDKEKSTPSPSSQKKYKIIKHLKDKPIQLEEMMETNPEEDFLYKLKSDDELYELYTLKFNNALDYKITYETELLLTYNYSNYEKIKIIEKYMNSFSKEELQAFQLKLNDKIEEIDNFQLLNKSKANNIISNQFAFEDIKQVKMRRTKKINKITELPRLNFKEYFQPKRPENQASHQLSLFIKEKYNKENRVYLHEEMANLIIMKS